MKDFNSYMQSRKSNAQKLAEQMKKTNYTNSNDDSRFWKPTMDKETGVGAALIRFLPSPNDDTLDYVEYRNYSFQWQETGQWFIEKSLFTLGIEDPVYQLRQRLYASGTEVDKELAKALPLSKVYIANILVITDPAHPENNGKTFLYRYNVTIQNLIEKALNPVADKLTGKIANEMNAFDLIEGAKLEIRIQNSKQGWRYEGTKFSELLPEAIVESQEEFQKIMSKAYPLSEFVAPSTFKTYDQLATRLAKVIGKEYIGSGIPVLTTPLVNPTKPVTASAIPAPQTAVAQEPKFVAPKETVTETAPFIPDSIDSDDDDALFDSMMAEMKS